MRIAHCACSTADCLFQPNSSSITSIEIHCPKLSFGLVVSDEVVFADGALAQVFDQSTDGVALGLKSTISPSLLQAVIKAMDNLVA